MNRLNSPIRGIDGSYPSFPLSDQLMKREECSKLLGNFAHFAETMKKTTNAAKPNFPPQLPSKPIEKKLEIIPIAGNSLIEIPSECGSTSTVRKTTAGFTKGAVGGFLGPLMTGPLDTYSTRLAVLPPGAQKPKFFESFFQNPKASWAGTFGVIPNRIFGSALFWGLYPWMTDASLKYGLGSKSAETLGAIGATVATEFVLAPVKKIVTQRRIEGQCYPEIFKRTLERGLKGNFHGTPANIIAAAAFNVGYINFQPLLVNWIQKGEEPTQRQKLVNSAFAGFVAALVASPVTFPLYKIGTIQRAEQTPQTVYKIVRQIIRKTYSQNGVRGVFSETFKGFGPVPVAMAIQGSLIAILGHSINAYLEKK